MRELSTADTLTYIKHAIDLETEIVTQNGLISAYAVSSAKRKPALFEEQLKETPYPKSSVGLYTVESFKKWASLLLLLPFVPIIMCLYLRDSFFTLATYTGFGIATLICTIPSIVFWIKYSSALKEYQAYDQSCREIDRANEAAKAKLEERNQQIRTKYRRALSEWETSNNEVKSLMNTSLTATQSALADLYAMDVIYPKYRTLPALTSIYEYLVTGRCDTLTGPHGAYNLYEDELRKDTVISQLNTVIENLEQIKQNQYMLYEQVKGIQQTTALVIAELEQIRGYTIATAELTALNTYYNRVNASISAAQLYCIS